MFQTSQSDHCSYVYFDVAFTPTAVRNVLLPSLNSSSNTRQNMRACRSPDRVIRCVGSESRPSFLARSINQRLRTYRNNAEKHATRRVDSRRASPAVSATRMQVPGSRRFGNDQFIVAALGDEELPHQHDERPPIAKMTNDRHSQRHGTHLRYSDPLPTSTTWWPVSLEILGVLSAVFSGTLCLYSVAPEASSSKPRVCRCL